MILPTAYFPPIFQWAKMIEAQDFLIENHEHFIKQSYRNRCEIYGANGKMNLIIPLKKWKNHSMIRDILISYEENWQKLHWKSIESAYRASPYFEFYEEDLQPFFTKKTFKYLVDFNEVTIELIKQLLKLSFARNITNEFDEVETDKDWRKIIHPKNNLMYTMVEYPKYIQVFEDKKGFIPNLSILDLLFNLGPESSTYLKSIK